MNSRALSLILSLSFIATAHAEEITPWNFVNGMMPKQAQIVQLTSAQATDEGLHIQTQHDGYIVWADSPIAGPTDVITLRAKSSRAVEGAILWQPKDSTDDNLIQMNFTVPAGDIASDINVIVSRYPQWDWETKQLALAFPAGSDVVIEEMQFRHWTFYERVGELWKSFWTFDTFKPFTINFLWGPLVTTNSAERAVMFVTLPPFAWSIGRIVYPFLLIVAVLAFIIGWVKHDKALGWGIFIATFAVIWLVFDLRMSSEIVSYATHDLQTYVFKEPAKKELRNFGTIYAHLDRFIPTVKKETTFVMLSPIREVYFPLSRYYAYPSVIIADPKEATGATLWMILDRTDVYVDSGAMLRMNDQIIAGPGKIIDAIDGSTFLFSTAP